MTILHYIPDTSNGQAEKFVQMLFTAMGKATEMSIVKGKQSRLQWLSSLYAVNPDIVHILACWSYNAAQVEKWTMSRGYNVIVSPHGGLSPKVMQQEFWKRRLPRIVAYQFLMIRHADAIHATSNEEVKALKELGWRKRIALISYIDTPTEATLAGTREEMMSLYEKVRNTTLRNRMSVRQMEALCALSYVAHTTEHQHPVLPQSVLNHIRTLSSHDWKAICTFAVDHNLERIVKKGTNTLMLTIPEQWLNLLTTKDIPRYTVRSRIVSCDTTRQLQNLMDNYDEGTERDIAAYIIALHSVLINHRSLTYKDLKVSVNSFEVVCLVCEKLRWETFNETLLLKMIAEAGLTSFASSLLHVMQEMQMLPLGFMPMDPVYNRMTNKIKNKITNLI